MHSLHITNSDNFQVGDDSAVCSFESYKTLLKTYLSMDYLDEVKLMQEKCTKGIRVNRMTFNELLHARAFACMGVGGRPWSMSPSDASGPLDRDKSEVSSLFPLTLSKRMTKITGENGSFVWKREVCDTELPSWSEEWLYSWLLAEVQLCGRLTENQLSWAVLD